MSVWEPVTTVLVNRFGDALLGVRGGISYRMSPNWTFNPAIGVAINLEEASRSSLFVDGEFAYRFPIGAYLGTGLTYWDFTHKNITTLGWLGTGGFPLWKNDAKKHQLDLSFEWRQFFDRGSDPDVNYMFWGGIKYTFK